MGRDGRRRIAASILVALSTSGFLIAQSSPSYRLEEHVFNAGGRPAETVVATSPSYRLRLESIGGSILGRAQSSGGYRLDAGFTAAYAPPGEVMGLDLLADQQTLSWSDEPASTVYNVYSGSLDGLPGLYGACAEARVSGTSWAGVSTPLPGAGFFYLVTGENRLWEEGTKGFASNGIERPNAAPCP